MNHESYDHQRAVLVEHIGHDEEELLEAVHELTDAARTRLDLFELLGTRIKEAPLPWLLGGLVFGLWLGHRHAASRVPMS